MTVLDMSLGGGVLIAVILVLRRGLLYRLPKWTFLLLWTVALCRLLIPFAVPSPLSVHTGAAWVVRLLKQEDIPLTPAFSVPLPETEPVPLLNAVWLTGTALCGLFFTVACLWSLRRFRDAVPAGSDFVRRWQAAHPTRFPVQIKISETVSAPLAYGLLRPVVLLPGDTDWSDENQLTYVLTHEYIHIRRGDLFWKTLLTAALCVHWFNPLMWIMYLRANQDLELACDEAVVRTLGLGSRKGYACALLAAAESGFLPLCITYTTKNHMEERIIAIMKIKKPSVLSFILALTLIVGVTTAFATSVSPSVGQDSITPATIESETNSSIYLGKDVNLVGRDDFIVDDSPYQVQIVAGQTGEEHIFISIDDLEYEAAVLKDAQSRPSVLIPVGHDDEHKITPEEWSRILEQIKAGEVSWKD